MSLHSRPQALNAPLLAQARTFFPFCSRSRSAIQGRNSPSSALPHSSLARLKHTPPCLTSPFPSLPTPLHPISDTLQPTLPCPQHPAQPCPPQPFFHRSDPARHAPFALRLPPPPLFVSSGRAAGQRPVALPSAPEWNLSTRLMEAAADTKAALMRAWRWRWRIQRRGKWQIKA